MKHHFSTFVVIYKLTFRSRRHILDRLDCNRNFDCFVGAGIASDFVAGYMLEVLQKEEKKGGIKVAIISDRQVSGYYYNKIENQFVLRDIKPYLITIDAQDNNKDLKTVSTIISDLTEFDFGQSDCVVAFGGGGVIDCASFAVSLYTGGCGFIVIPTTLGAMIDSSVSLKSYVNSGKHKDSASTSNCQNAVFIDPTFLPTVPVKFRSNGYAQIIRYGVLADPALLSDLSGISDSAPSDIRLFLNRAYSARAALERKNPQLLTFGNEIASAIEGYFRFMNYSEGEALAISLYASLPEKIRKVLEPLYSKLGLSYRLEGVSGSMIRRSLEDTLARNKDKTVKVVDYDRNADGKMEWVIREIDKPEAMKLFEKRLAVISPSDG